MAKMTGLYAQVTMDVDGTPVEIAELRDWSISVNSEKVDGNVAGTKWSEHLIGRISWEGEATCVSVDSYWMDLMDAFITVNFYDHLEDAEAAYSGQASLDFERSVSHDDLIESSFTYTGNGELLTPKGSAPVV